MTGRRWLAGAAMALVVLAALGMRALTRRGLTVVEHRFPNGQVSERRTYRHGLEEGVHRGWYPSGARRFVYRYARGVMEGVQETWYPDGGRHARFEYVGGHEAGRQRMWTDRGVLRANYVVEGNRRFGLMGATGCMGPAHGDSAAVIAAAVTARTSAGR